MQIIFTVFFVICHIKVCSTLLEVNRTLTTDTFNGIECINVRNAHQLPTRNPRNCSCDIDRTLLSDVDGKVRCLDDNQIQEKCSNLAVFIGSDALTEKNLVVGELFQGDCKIVILNNLQWWNYKKLKEDQDMGEGVWEDHDELKKEVTLGNIIMKINTEKYHIEGLVLKLILSCQQETDDSKDDDEECVIIKIPGIRKYPLSYNDLLVVPLTTKETTTTKTTTLKPKVTTTTKSATKSTEALASKDNSESDNQTLVIGILIPVILLLLIIVIILIIIKRKRNKKDQSVEKPSTIKPTTQKPVPPPTYSAQPNPYTFDDHDYKELESEYAPSSVASTNQGFISTSPQRSVLKEQNDTYSDISPKYKGRNEIYTGLNNDAVIYNELEIYSKAPNNNYTAPTDETHYHEVEEIDNDNYYSAVAGQPHVSPPPYTKVQKYK